MGAIVGEITGIESGGASDSSPDEVMDAGAGVVVVMR